MTGDEARDILVAGAHAVAHGDGLRRTLQRLLDTIAGHGAASAAIVMPDADGALGIVASFGLDAAAAAGLTGAMTNPGHPIATTMHETTPTFDVLPTVPGGPRLRSHLPLVVTRDGTDAVLGVLALAHEQPIDPSMRPVLQGIADLAAVAMERARGG